MEKSDYDILLKQLMELLSVYEVEIARFKHTIKKRRLPPNTRNFLMKILNFYEADIAHVKGLIRERKLLDVLKYLKAKKEAITNPKKKQEKSEPIYLPIDEEYWI